MADKDLVEKWWQINENSLVCTSVKLYVRTHTKVLDHNKINMLFRTHLLLM